MSLTTIIDLSRANVLVLSGLVLKQASQVEETSQDGDIPSLPPGDGGPRQSHLGPRHREEDGESRQRHSDRPRQVVRGGDGELYNIRQSCTSPLRHLDVPLNLIL